MRGCGDYHDAKDHQIMKSVFSIFRALALLSCACIFAAGCGTGVERAGAGTPRGTIEEKSPPGDTCPVHHIKMTMQRAEIMYGLVRFAEPQPSQAVRDRNFPFAEPPVLGGCCVSSFSPKYEKRYVCPECRRAEKKWYDAHPKLESGRR